MKNELLIIVIIISLKVAGQTPLIGLKGGVNFPNITASNFITQSDPRKGLTAGLTYELLFEKDFSIGADLIYNQRGFTNDFVIFDDLGNPSDEKYKSKFNYDYISLPIKAGFNTGTKLYGFTNIGVIPSLLVDARSTLPTFDSDAVFTGNKTFDVTELVSKFDFAGLLELGGGYKFKGRYWLFTAFSYQVSFTTISNSEYFTNSKIRNNGMALTIGLKYALSKA